MSENLIGVNLNNVGGTLDSLFNLAADKVALRLRLAAGDQALHELEAAAYYQLVTQRACEVQSELAAAEQRAAELRIALESAEAAKQAADIELRKLNAAMLTATDYREKSEIAGKIPAAERVCSNRTGEWRSLKSEYQTSTARVTKLTHLAAALAGVEKPATPLLGAFIEKILA